MRLAFLLATHGGSPLTIGLERGFRKLGHEVFSYEPSGGYDLIFVWNQSAHRLDYVYPEFPPESDRTPIAFIDSAEYGWTKRVHEPISRYWNAFAPGSMGHDTRVFEQQERLRRFLEGRSFPYFVREFANDWNFPSAYHPIDYPLYEPSRCHRRPSRNEYLSRRMEVACIWGLSNPWRVNLTAELEASSFHKDVYVIERDGPRLSQWGGNGYFSRLEAARCSISFDGYGSGSFRMTEVLCRTLLMQGPLSIRTHAPLIHGETCWAYCVWVNGPEYLRSDLVEQIGAAMADPERSFQIYARGYDHCMTHLTERATAQYVMDTCHYRHDWGKPTEL